MNNLFTIQYQLIRKTRGIVFDFLRTTVADDVNKKLPSYGELSIAELISHVGACYINWLAYFAMRLPQKELPPEMLYEEVDAAVYAFLRQFEHQMNEKIEGLHDTCGRLTTTPAELFTHVITHEAHHKGQIVNMCRVLGYIPPETDVSLFFGL